MRIRHACIIGDRCKKFNVSVVGMPFVAIIKHKVIYNNQIQTLHGSSDNIKQFIEDLKADKSVINFEENKNTLFFTEVRNSYTPTTCFGSNLLSLKPVRVNTEGYEFWELCSWKKEHLAEFITKISLLGVEYKIYRFNRVKISNLYYSPIYPDLTEKQKTALELALKEGFYSWPKKINLKELARIMNISTSSYREHLKRAESKIMPDLIDSMA